jgi:hypothetical protein
VWCSGKNDVKFFISLKMDTTILVKTFHLYDGTITFLYEDELECECIKNQNISQGFRNVTVLKPIRKKYEELYLVQNPLQEDFDASYFVGSSGTDEKFREKSFKNTNISIEIFSRFISGKLDGGWASEIERIGELEGNPDFTESIRVELEIPTVTVSRIPYIVQLLEQFQNNPEKISTLTEYMKYLTDSDVKFINGSTEELEEKPKEEIKGKPDDEPTEEVKVELEEKPSDEPKEEVKVELEEKPSAEPKEEIRIELEEKPSDEPKEEIKI